MNSNRNCIAFDIGGSRGRCVLGQFDGNRLHIKETGSFPSLLASIKGILYWDIVYQFEALKDLLHKTCTQENADLDSIGIDSMGVNFALLDQNQSLIGIPFCTRVFQQQSVLNYVDNKFGLDRLFSIAGMQPQKLNSLYFLAEMKMNKSPTISIAKHFLMLPDLLNYWLSGEMASEYCIASTSAMLDAKSRNWSREILDFLELDNSFCSPIINTFTSLGKLSVDNIANHHLNKTVVIESPMHDTAASLLCLGGNTDKLFISIGTWGIIGAELADPVLSKDVIDAGFTNEGAAYKRIRLDYNAPGTSLLRCCMAEWKKTDLYVNYTNISLEASSTECQHIFINPRSNYFFASNNMVKTIQSYCLETNQIIPTTRGQIARLLTESWAMCCKVTITKLEKLLHRSFHEVYVMGGGCQDAFMCQCIANALNKTVIAGPVEASSIGNLLGQLITLGEIKPGYETMSLVINSFIKKEYYPTDCDRWDDDMNYCLSKHIF